MTSTTTHTPAPPRELVSSAVLGSLAARVAADENTDPSTAERIVEQALAFLAACALNPGKRLAPCKAVDAGWHAFILHTAEYSEFCERVAGRFIHHCPAPPSGDGDTAPGAVGATIAAMRAAGLPVDTALWVPAANCSQCYQGCTSDPRGA